MLSHREKLQKLLKGTETGDPEAATVVNESRYVQHNPRTAEGSIGLAELFARLAKTNPRVSFVRVFEDGDFAFAHNEYDFDGVEIAFEVFRFEDGLAVEHWDNIQLRQPLNPSGRGMLDGETLIGDLDRTEDNRELVRTFVSQVLIDCEVSAADEFLSPGVVQHHPEIGDGRIAFVDALQRKDDGVAFVRYEHLHRVLAEGNFVLCMSEGHRAGEHAGLYDLFRVDDGKIVECWNTTSIIAPESEWKNDNGKF